MSHTPRKPEVPPSRLLCSEAGVQGSIQISRESFLISFPLCFQFLNCIVSGDSERSSSAGRSSGPIVGGGGFHRRKSIHVIECVDNTRD
jgi:hypothetical protein